MILVLIVCILFLSSCAVAHVKKNIEDYRRDAYLNTVTWVKARNKARNMCAEVACGKIILRHPSNSWTWENMPSHQAFYQLFEQDLRKAKPSLKLYEEAGFAIAHALSKRIDAGEITTIEYVNAFEAALKYIRTESVKEVEVLHSNLKAAQLTDAETMETLQNVAIGMAVAATAVILIDAATRPVPVQPIHCNAQRFGNMVHWTCY